MSGIVTFLTTSHFSLFWKPTHLPLLYYNADTEESHNELILSLNKNLLRSVETQEGIPNPSIHLALRLSNSHNQAKELDHLNRLKNDLHNDIQRYIVLIIKVYQLFHLC